MFIYRYLLACFLTGWFSIGLAQYPQGKITDNKGEAIAYATICIKNSNKGCFSDEDGCFHLDHHLNNNDTLIISCIGFATTEVSATSLAKEVIIELTPSNHQLAAVTVSSKKQILKKVKDNKRISCSACLTKGMEIVTFIDVPAGSVLNDVTFYCQRTFARRLLAIRIYSCNAHGQPDQNLVPLNRVIEINPFQSQFIFDLKDLNITVPKGGVFAGVQFIEVNEQGTPKQKKTNPYLYFSTKTERQQTYLRPMGHPFRPNNFICSVNGRKTANLQCSYSYFVPCHIANP